MRAALTALLLCVLSAHAQLFTEDFEDNSFSSCGWYDGDSDAALNTFVDTSVYSPHGGSAASLRLHWDLAATSPATPKRRLFTASETVYISFDMKLGSSGTTWQGSGQTYHPHVLYMLTDANDEFDGLAWDYLTWYFEPHVFTPWVLLQDGQRIDTGNLGVDLLGSTSGHAIAGGNGNQTQAGVDETDYYAIGGGDYTNAHVWHGSATFVNDTWHVVELYVAMNSISGSTPQADGVLRMWVDDVLVLDKTNVYLRTAQYSTQKFNQFVIAPYIGDGSPIAQDMWIDNLVIDTAPPSSALRCCTVGML